MKSFELLRLSGNFYKLRSTYLLFIVKKRNANARLLSATERNTGMEAEATQRSLYIIQNCMA